MTTAFVLGGGGVLGAVEVGMLRALFERGVAPDLVLGTSVGALNGALVARDPSLAVIDRLTELWRGGGRPGRGLAGPAPPDEQRERSEEPPLDRVEQVADRREPAGVR